MRLDRGATRGNKNHHRHYHVSHSTHSSLLTGLPEVAHDGGVVGDVPEGDEVSAHHLAEGPGLAPAHLRGRQGHSLRYCVCVTTYLEECLVWVNTVLACMNSNLPRALTEEEYVQSMCSLSI